jgi:hypothetical protein
MKREDMVVGICGVLFLLSIILIFSQGMKTTGYATTSTTYSNVTISTYYAIDMSTNLSAGIYFGNITSLPAVDQNATHNFDGVNTTVSGFGPSYWMNVSSDTNGKVDFCIEANADLKSSGGDTIVLGNESYSNSTSTNYTIPYWASSATAFTTSYVRAGSNISAGGNNYYRFWLDVPSATPSGNFNNSILFKAVSSGGSC